MLKLKNKTSPVLDRNHEINNLLMAILGNVQILLTRPGIDSRDLNTRLESIEESVRMIARITAGSGDQFQEIESGK
jgi:signal transduction histidine kinase